MADWKLCTLLVLCGVARVAEGACFLSSQCDCSNTVAGLAVLDCSNRDLNSMPSIKVLRNAVYSVDLSYNLISTLPSSWFSTCFSSVLSVTVVSNPLVTVTNDAFAGTTISQLVITYTASGNSSANPSFTWSSLNPILSTLVNLTVNGYYAPTLTSSVANAPNLRYLSLANNQIGALTAGSLAGMVSLTWLDLSSNKLPSVPTTILSQLPALQTLILSNNQIWSIGGNIVPLNGLTYLDLSRNLIQRVLAGAFTSANLATLTYLDLTRNQLSDATVTGLSAFTALQTLKIGQNGVTSVQSLLDRCCQNSSLLYLDISQNWITQLNADSFASVASSLSTLVLDSNTALISMDAGTFNSLKNLTMLQANNIQWATVLQQSPDIFSSATTLAQTLTDLQMDDGSLTSALLPGISTLTNLQVLSLQYNLINSIPPFFFQHFSKLQQLSLNTDADLNQLSSISVYGLVSLQTLDLSYSGISNLSVCLSQWLPSLRSIALISVALNCDCNLLWLKNWAATQAATYSSSVGSEFVCAYPATLSGQSVTNVNAASFVCPNGQTAQSLSSCEDIDALVLQNASFVYTMQQQATPDGQGDVTYLVSSFAPYQTLVKQAFLNASSLDGGTYYTGSSVSQPTSNVSLQVNVHQGSYNVCLVVVTAQNSRTYVTGGCSLVNVAGVTSASVSLVAIVVPAVVGTVVVLLAVVLTVVLVKRRAGKHGTNGNQRTAGDPFSEAPADPASLARLDQNGTRYTKKRADMPAASDVGNSNSLPVMRGHGLYENAASAIRPPREFSNRAFSLTNLSDHSVGSKEPSVQQGASNRAFAQSTTTIDTHESIPLPRRPQNGHVARNSADRPDTTYYEELPYELPYANMRPAPFSLTVSASVEHSPPDGVPSSPSWTEPPPTLSHYAPPAVDDEHLYDEVQQKHSALV